MLLVGMGVGAFVLPFFGYQFNILAWMGEAVYPVAIGMAGLGVYLIVKS